MVWVTAVLFVFVGSSQRMFDRVLGPTLRDQYMSEQHLPRVRNQGEQTYLRRSRWLTLAIGVVLIIIAIVSTKTLLG